MKDLDKMSKEELILLIAKNQLFVAEDKLSVKGPYSVLPELLRYAKMDREHFVVLTLDSSYTLISRYVVSIGTVNRSIVHPREVFRKAIKDNAASIIVAHNHPSGKVVPSPEDNDITSRLKSSGEIMGIPLLDHIIIGKNGEYYSFLESGTF